jgi:hypothetical protein
MAGADSVHFAINSLLSALLHRVLPKIALAIDGKSSDFFPVKIKSKFLNYLLV